MLERGQYRFRITHSDDVEVTSNGDTLALRLQSVPDQRHSLWRSSTECVATVSGGLSPLSIRRIRRFPVPRFFIASGSERRATIQCTHPLRSRYRISLACGTTWVFHMPLFRARFYGSSTQAGSVHVRAIRENLWEVLLHVDQNSSDLLAAVACIQRARWLST